MVYKCIYLLLIISINLKFTLKVSVYKYFPKLGQQTKKQQFMRVLLNKSFADVFSSLLDVFDWCSLVQFKKNIIRKEMSLLKKLTLSNLRFSLKENLKKCARVRQPRQEFHTKWAKKVILEILAKIDPIMQLWFL